MKKKVAVYCRVSTFDQQKGLKSQERALKAYCSNHGFTNLVWYRDKMTGSTTKRPAFKKLQHDIFIGRVGAVVCWKLDRISRSLKDGINVLTKWLAKGVRIVAITQDLDFNGKLGEFMMAVLFAFAQMERENLRENTKRGIAAARARGVRLGKRPGQWCKKVSPLLKAGLTIGEVADRLGKSRQAVYDVLKRANIVDGKCKP